MMRIGRGRRAREASHIPTRGQKKDGGWERGRVREEVSTGKMRSLRIPSFEDNKLQTIQVE